MLSLSIDSKKKDSCDIMETILPSEGKSVLQEKLLNELQKCYPTVEVLLVVVHDSKWWTVNVFLPESDADEDEFGSLVGNCQYLLGQFWSNGFCLPRPCKGRKIVGDRKGPRHFFTAWLPIPPARKVEDFWPQKVNGHR